MVFMDMKKIRIKINESQFNKIIKDCVKDTYSLFEREDIDAHGALKLEPSPISNMRLLILDNEEKAPWNEQVWRMLEDSYANHGGLKSYSSYKDFLKKDHNFIIVLSEKNELLACATYRVLGQGFKMSAIGCVQDEIGKLALQEIVKHNITNLNLHYWAEVSGAIEHYFKKHNGYPMPNTMASEILGVPADRIKLCDEDKVHYERIIGPDGDWYVKMIFGIKDEATFNRVLEIMDNYEGFMKEVNNMVTESNTMFYNIRQAMYIIDNIYRCNEEDGFNEMLPSWHRAIKQSIYTLESIENKERYIERYIKTAYYLLEKMPLLTLNKMPSDFMTSSLP